MTDLELHHGLGLLADEAEPAPVDVYDVITKAKARTRNGRATVATALATATVAGAMIATIGFSGSSSGPVVGSPPLYTSTTSISTAPKPIFDERSDHLTQVLAEAWPTIAPAGVTVEDSSVPVSGSDLSALEFGGTPVEPRNVMYEARAMLSDAQGSTEFSIQVWPPGDVAGEFAPCTSNADVSCEYRQLEDGTRANASIDLKPSATANPTMEADILRPDGTRIWVYESNTDQHTLEQGLTRPTTFFTAEELIPFGMLFTY